MKPKLILTTVKITPESFGNNLSLIEGQNYIDFDFNIQGISSGNFSKYFKNDYFDRQKFVNDILNGKISICGKADALK